METAQGDDSPLDSAMSSKLLAACMSGCQQEHVPDGLPNRLNSQFAQGAAEAEIHARGEGVIFAAGDCWISVGGRERFLRPEHPARLLSP